MKAWAPAEENTMVVGRCAAPAGRTVAAACWSVTAALVCLALMLAALPGAAAASDAPASDAAGIRRVPRPFAKASTRSVLEPFPAQARMAEVTERSVVLRDAEDWSVRALVPLDPPPYLGPQGTVTTGPTTLEPEGQGVFGDPASGRLFVVYQSVSRTSSEANVNADKDPTHFSRTTASGRVCAGLSQVWHGAYRPCVDGVHVVDVVSGEVTSLSLSKLALDGAFAGPALLAAGYGPSAGAGKVLLLLTELGHHVDPPILFGSTATTRHRTANQAELVYAVQLDIATGRRDWAVRIEACRGSREGPAEWVKTMKRPYAAAIFSSRVQADRAVYVGCNLGNNAQGIVVRVPLGQQGSPAAPVAVKDPAGVTAASVAAGAGARPQSSDLVEQGERQRVWVGPDQAWEFLADPDGGRLLVRSLFAGDVWWVFDQIEGGFIGAIGIGDYSYQDIAVGMDPATGRFYALAANSTTPTGLGRAALYVVDSRRTPLPQALVFPSPSWGLVSDEYLVVESAVGERPRRIWKKVFPHFEAVEDHVPVSLVPPASEAVLSADVDERPGATAVSFDGTARGYGARVILVGGVAALARVGPVDPHGAMVGYGETLETFQKGSLSAHVLDRPDNACTPPNREVVLAFVGPEGPATVDGGGSKGSVQPVMVDGGTSADAAAPADRCGAMEWEALWQKALFGRAPVGSPGAGEAALSGRASCVSSDAEPSQSWADPVGSAFAARIECGQDGGSGWAQARGFGLDDLRVSEALSSFRIYRDPGRGLVSRVESVARGITVDGVLGIDSVRGTAESWANGRRQPAGQPDREGYDPNCDFERTAGTCFQRHLFGVATAAYRCGPCGDEAAAIDALGRAVGQNGGVRLREPDERLARGSADGYIAAVQKEEADRFADLIMNNDLLQTTLPTLEIVRYAPAGFVGVNTVGKPASPVHGRQVYQFAGVEVATSYGIQCLLVHDSQKGTCEAAPEEPGSLVVQLQDEAGASLAGGRFEIRGDGDGDGLLGLTDELVPDGACVTASDGVGTCRFAGLAPGPYLVSQVAAPAGYGALAEPWLAEVGPGEARTVTFLNQPDVATVRIVVTDEAGRKLAGARFAVYPDADTDGQVAAGAAPVAECVTGADGACVMRVPAGAYVLVQTAAAAGLEAIEPVAFAFATAGQVASVEVVNVAAAAGEPPVPRAAEPAPLVVYEPGPVLTPREVTSDQEPSAVPPADIPVVAEVGGTIERIVRAPSDVLRLLARAPREAAAWTAVLVLYALAVLVLRRRRLVATLLAQAGAPALVPLAPRPSGTPGDGMAAAVALRERRGPIAGGAAGRGPGALGLVVAVSDPALARLVASRTSQMPDAAVLARADSLAALLAALAASRPAVVVVDLALADVNELTASLGAHHPLERVVGLVAEGAPAERCAEAAFAAGLGSVLVGENDLGNGNLAYCIRQVAAGARCFGPKAQTLLLERWYAASGTGPLRVQPYLTEREIEVARLAALGLRREIGRRLYISEPTVKSHLRQVRKKLEMANPRDYRELRRRLEQLGLFEPDE